MSSIPFERYDDEFLELTMQVRKSLSKISLDEEEGGRNHDFQSDLNMASSLLTQCDDLMKQMSVEARGEDNPSSKKKYLQKVRVCKAQLANLNDDYNKIQNKIQ